MHPLMMGSLSWIEYQQRLQNKDTVVLIPCGTLEQHNPHLPLGTDALLSTSVAQSVAEQINGIVAPTVSYGYKSQPKSGGGQHFPGTTSLDGNSLSQLLLQILLLQIDRYRHPTVISYRSASARSVVTHFLDS